MYHRLIRAVLALSVFLFLGAKQPDSLQKMETSSSNQLTEKAIQELLSPERHLIAAKAVFSNDPDNPLFLQQIEAIRQAGELKLAALVPNLISFLDYPSSIGFLTPSSSWNLQRANEQWPAFEALLKIGKNAAPSLKQFIGDSTVSIDSRVAVLTVLKEINSGEAQTAGKSLLKSLNDPYAIEAVNAVINGKSRFWGVRHLGPSELKHEMEESKVETEK